MACDVIKEDDVTPLAEVARAGAAGGEVAGTHGAAVEEPVQQRGGQRHLPEGGSSTGAG